MLWFGERCRTVMNISSAGHAYAFQCADTVSHVCIRWPSQCKLKAARSCSTARVRHADTSCMRPAWRVCCEGAAPLHTQVHPKCVHLDIRIHIDKAKTVVLAVGCSTVVSKMQHASCHVA